MNEENLDEFVRENSEMLSRVLACGNEEARAYALALLANCEASDSVEDVEEQLGRIKLELA
ncbi:MULTISPECIES: hypothetical protein [unclassified Haloferax]|uniref:hypothetical protein n=1 Tax=unclassified Haloferax TaxID=2625095 RepID=UPI0028764524|nr:MULTISPECIES: hypothetical protein [unclassified Haloferax]MDS0243043.1 hypothetical protein [Haloferax sp. S2CR25]MDS0446164.1 hypothetical protein [Haloferax sp. S2CR25-2]